MKCEHCDNEAQTHKYDQHLCYEHFYQEWRKRLGDDLL